VSFAPLVTPAEPRAPAALSATDGLEFLPGQIKLGASEVDLRGKPWQVLKALHSAPGRRLSLAMIISQVWDDNIVEEPVARDHICTARTALRKLLDCGVDYDPIPCVERGASMTAFAVKLRPAEVSDKE
jgi:hypothetical protein